EAERLLAEMTALKTKPVHEVFGLQPDASIDAYRASFFALVRRFYPERIPSTPEPGLKQAYAEMFQLLSKLMTQVEALNRAKRAPPAKPAPSFPPHDFIGWERRGDNRVYCDIPCTLKNAVQIFNSHTLVNISNGGFFLAASRSPPLGEAME